MSWKKFLLLICKILGLFVNTLSSDDKYSLLNMDNLTQPIQMWLSQKEIFFLNLFDHFWRLDWISKISKKKKKRWPSQLMYFRNYGIQKTWLEQNLFWTLFERHHGKWVQTLMKSARQQLYYIYWPLQTQLSWKNPVVVRLKILGLFVITLAGDDKSALLHRDDLTFLNLLLHFPNPD